MTSSRKSNFELLRILAMFLIVLHHACVHGAIKLEGISAAGLLVANELSIGGKLGVDLFVMITGYFMVKSTFKTKSFVHIFTVTLFYALVIIGVFYLFAPDAVTLKSAIKSLQLKSSGALPWFAVAYLGMYLFVPYLNKLALSLSKTDYKRLLVIAFICLSVVPTALNVDFIASYFVWFLFLYLTAGYIRLFGIRIVQKHKLVATLLPLAIIVISIGVFSAFPQLTKTLGINARYFANTYSCFILICAVGVFYLFKDLEIGHSKFINKVASTTFGIYLIHDNSLVLAWLWPHFKAVFSLNASTLWIGLLLTACLVFAACALIEAVRQLLALLLPKAKRVQSLYAQIDGKMRLQREE